MVMMLKEQYEWGYPGIDKAYLSDCVQTKLLTLEQYKEITGEDYVAQTD